MMRQFMANILTTRMLRRVLAVGGLLAIMGVGLWLTGAYALAEYHIRQAHRSLERQRYDVARMEFEKALRYRPASAQLHLLAARTARQSGKFPTAWEHLHRCRELQKGVSADLQLEELLVRAQTGEFEEVFRFLEPYLQQDDERTPLVLETLSHAYLFLYRLDNAWQCLQRWLQLQPDNVEALFLRGKYYTLVANLDMALADLQRALELDPTRVEARILLGQTFRQHHRTPEATAEFQLVLQQRADNFEARLGLAGCYVDEGSWSKAEATLEGIGQSKAEDGELPYLRGRIAEGQGQYERAVSFLRAAIAVRPSDNVACVHLIRCYQQLGDESSASKSQELLDRIEKDQERLLAITNKEKEGLATNPALCCELGEVCLRLGLKRRGLHWLQAALFLDPHYRRAHEQLLRYYEQLGPESQEDAAFHRRMLNQ
jgi:tetratricopeptide (TPR) repeat protein